jgi:hypothetical protein
MLSKEDGDKEEAEEASVVSDDLEAAATVLRELWDVGDSDEEDEMRHRRVIASCKEKNVRACE